MTDAKNQKAPAEQVSLGDDATPETDAQAIERIAQPSPSPKEFLRTLPSKFRRVIARTGKVYLAMDDAGNRYAILVGSRKADNIIRRLAHRSGITLRKIDLVEINEILTADAEMTCIVADVWYRIASIPGGIEIDLGDENHTRIRITAGKVEIVRQGSTTLFYRTAISKPMVMPAEVGNLKLLNKHLNLHPVQALLLIGWISYTLAHPKVDSAKFVILVLKGGQGRGKSYLCRIIQTLIDPSRVGVQLFPRNGEELAIAAQNCHVLFYDNIREVKPYMSDILCVASTGGDISKRQLYTDAEQQVIRLHGALVLNGIYSFIDQPDLAQRCLPLELQPISESNRKSEAELAREFHADLPAIQRGLFDLIAEILRHLPSAKVAHPERMYDFAHWLAAMERAYGVPEGVYQSAYSDALQQGQRDSLQDNPLAAAVLEFAEGLTHREWTDSPSGLLTELNALVNLGTQRSKDWPANAIALSKRLAPLQASLLSQGIRVEFGRGKERTVTIAKMGGDRG